MLRQWLASARRHVPRFQKRCIVDLRRVHKLHPDLSRYRYVSHLGRGGFGAVTCVRDTTTGLLFSVKSTGKSHLRPVERRALRHPFIVRMRNSWLVSSKGDRVLLFDFVRGPELRHLLQRAPTLVQSNAQFYASQIASAIGYLSRRGIVHRDIKPDNVLMCEKGYLKLADFGLATRIDAPPSREFAGTLAYASPESIISGTDVSGSDWWALGVILYEMLVGVHPFMPKSTMPSSEVTMRIIAGPPPSFPSSVPAPAQDLISSLLDHDVAARCAFAAGIREHAFFAGLDWEALARQKMMAPVVDLSIHREWKDKFILDGPDPIVFDRPDLNAQVEAQAAEIASLKAEVADLREQLARAHEGVLW